MEGVIRVTGAYKSQHYGVVPQFQNDSRVSRSTNTMKVLFVLGAILSVSLAAPSGIWGHGLGLAGPILGAAAVAGPHVGHATVAGPVAGGATVSGAVAGPAVVSGSVAGPSAVIGSVAGHTVISEPSLGLGHAWGSGVIVGAPGAALVAGPDGGVISSHGAAHGAIVAHGAHW